MKPTDPASSKETLIVPDVLIGKMVGAYEVRGLLGKGGMGVVYRAYDASLDREVALKILPPALSGDRDYAERFLREARMAAKIDHPRIVPVYAAGAGESGAWIAMQLVRGRTLHEELHDGMRPTFAQAVRLARQIAEALGAAHKAGLIHRDIKPANVIVDAAGDAKVLDFGLARPQLSTGHTQDGTYLGTPEYSSPEQCQTNDIDHRADLYSLGVVMYEVLGGRIPHVAETPLNLFHKIMNEEPLALRDLNPRVPPSLAAIVSRLMAKNRDARYADAQAVIADLDKVQVREDKPGRGETVMFGPADRARVAAWTLAGVLASLLVAAVVHVSPWTSQAASGTGDGQGSQVTDKNVTPRIPAKLRGRVVFLDFKNLTSDPEVGWMASGVPELISFGLAERGGLDPIERDAVIDAMRREFNARITSGGTDSVSAVQEQGLRLLRALDADVLVRGSFYARGEEVSLQAVAYGLREGVLDVLGSVKESGKAADLLKIADRSASRLADLVHPPEQEELRVAGKLNAPGSALPAPDSAPVGMVARLEDKAKDAREQRRRGDLKKSVNSPAPGDALAPQQDGEPGKKSGTRQDRKEEDRVAGRDDGGAAPPAAGGGSSTRTDKENPKHKPQAPGLEEKTPPTENDEGSESSQDGYTEELEKQELRGFWSRTLAIRGNESRRSIQDVVALMKQIAQERRDREHDLPELEMGGEGAAR